MEFQTGHGFTPLAVKVDLYTLLSKDREYETILGIDIGSTSTKAILTSNDNSPLAGFYTYTAGKPVEAIQAIFEAIDDLIKKQGSVYLSGVSELPDREESLSVKSFMPI